LRYQSPAALALLAAANFVVALVVAYVAQARLKAMIKE
jgi:uncharacterized protein YejL (UPF0352 family)